MRSLIFSGIASALMSAAANAAPITILSRKCDCLLMAAVVSSFFSLLYGVAAAQENEITPPPALQFPYEAGKDTPSLSLAFIRERIQRGADTALCEVLIREQIKTAEKWGLPPPPEPGQNFQIALCPPELLEKIVAGDGRVQWMDDARPLECGHSCFGKPFMVWADYRKRPNLRQARIRGTLKFKIDDLVNRSLTFPYELNFICKAENGARHGVLEISTTFYDPVIGDPGAIESIVDFITLGAFSNLVESTIKKEIQNVSTPGETRGPCESVGTFVADRPNSDSITSDKPPSATTSIPGTASAPVAGARAKVRFLRIKRNPPSPFLVEFEVGALETNEAGQFMVFVNGEKATFPTFSVPPAQGGQTNINFCKTVNMEDADRVQVLFVNGLGGAVWSQFGRAENFGAGPSRSMITGRDVMLRDEDRSTGSRPSKIHKSTFREFELTYRIEYSAGPSISDQPPISNLPSRRSAPNGNTLSGAATATRPPATAGAVMRLPAETLTSSSGACREI